MDSQAPGKHITIERPGLRKKKLTLDAGG